MSTHFSLRPGSTLHPFHGAAEDEYIVETSDGRRFKLSGKARRLLDQLDEGTSLEDVCARSGNVGCDELRDFILANYGEFLVCPSGESFANRLSGSTPRAKNGLSLSWTVVPRRWAAAISSRLSFCYRPVVAIFFLLAIIASHALLYFSPGSTPASAANAHVSIILILCIGSILAHEFGHASALARYGGSPSGIGFGLYILLPVFYADVSQAWKLRQWQRVVVDLGGVYFQQVFFAVTASLAVILRNPSLRAVCVAIDIMTFIALNPALRFDGYWVITDWLGLSNLHRSSILYLRGLGSSLMRFRPQSSSSYPKHLGHAKTAAFISYALLSNAFMALLIAFNFQWFHSVALALWNGLPALGSQFLDAVMKRDWIRSVDLAIACAFLVASGTTLFIGMFYQARALIRLLRRKLLPTKRESSHSLGAHI